MQHTSYGKEWAHELQAEAPATRKCLERIPNSTFGWKPHEKSMEMGYLALLVAEIPRWISAMIELGEIDFATYEQTPLNEETDLVAHFDKNYEKAKKALESLQDEDISKSFSLKNNGTVLYSSPLKESIGSTINHWVHHRGQLTVYMRLNEIPVPSIYGPSADEKTF
ncbi:DinB family protein [Flavihumibacter solisilvae]|uniref:Damage-inducible protein DinB n=1 Tax=Flavihumibacter solisilvae TaxID=1349421 RepID=A0A0C1ING9_9BACT|nr:DinB family protein [Flavihumibacter solisilvae]KIC95790.1 damage-inducible protein DinB [Flavihumibacter solisilvae]